MLDGPTLSTKEYQDQGKEPEFDGFVTSNSLLVFFLFYLKYFLEVHEASSVLKESQPTSFHWLLPALLDGGCQSKMVLVSKPRGFRLQGTDTGQES